MRKQYIYLPLAVLAVSLTACSTPKKDYSDLKAQIDASRAGHYGQAMLHEEISEEYLEDANTVLGHLEKDHYWNINEKAKALQDAQQALHHRVESEKEMCKWLTEVHTDSLHNQEPGFQSNVYFKTGSSTPFKVDNKTLDVIGHFLAHNPDATATVTAYADTVGKPAANLTLSQNRANAVSAILVKSGAKASQLTVKGNGEGKGPDNTPNQDNRIATVVTLHAPHVDCGNLLK